MFLNKILKIKNNKSLVNGALFSLFSFINKGFIFLLLLILANYITPGEYGYLSLFTTIVMLIGYFTAMSTEGFMSVAYFRDRANGIKKTFSCVFFTTIISTLVFLLPLIFWGEQIAEIAKLPINTVYLALIIAFFTIYTNINLDVFRIKGKVGFYGALSCGNALLNFVLSIFFIKSLLWGWQGRVYAQCLCFALFGVFAIFYFIKEGYLSWPDSKHWKEMLIFGLPIIPTHATLFLRQGCDRYIIDYFHTIEDVGLFSLALNLTNIIIMVGTGFNQSNSVDIYTVLSDKTKTGDEKRLVLKKQRKQIFNIYVIATIIISAICYFFIPYILPKYKGCENYFLILAVFGFTQCIYFLYINYLYYYKETKKIMYIIFGSAILHLTLSLLLTRFSLYCTCTIYLVSQGIVLLLVKREAEKIIKNL